MRAIEKIIKHFMPQESQLEFPVDIKKPEPIENTDPQTAYLCSQSAQVSPSSVTILTSGKSLSPVTISNFCKLL